jgi:lysozyme
MATVNQFNREFVNTPLGFSITDSNAFPVNPDSPAAQMWLEYAQSNLYQDIASEQGMALVKEYEAADGPSLDAYQTKGDVPTIGYGNTYYSDGTPVQLGDKITKPEAEKLFSDVYGQHTDHLSKTIPNWDSLNPNIQDGITSFAYNLGLNFYDSGDDFKTITAAIKTGDPEQIAEAMQLYYKSGNPANDAGLQRRRRAEGDLVLKPYNNE